MDWLTSRRELIAGGAQISLAGVLAMATSGVSALAADKVCADPSKMDGGQQSLRTSLHYAEVSPDAAKTCSACGFFQAGEGGCGNCMIFTGPANQRGHCDSWSAKS